LNARARGTARAPNGALEARRSLGGQRSIATTTKGRAQPPRRRRDEGRYLSFPDVTPLADGQKVHYPPDPPTTTTPRSPGCRWSWSAGSEQLPDHDERQHQSVLWLESSGQVFDRCYTGWTPLRDGHALVINYARGDAPKPVLHAYRVAIE